MKSTHLFLLALILLFPLAGAAQTAESLLEKYAEAIGGKARLDSLKNFGYLAEVDGQKHMGYRQRGNLARSEVRPSNQNYYVCTCFDGESGWALASTAKAPFQTSDAEVNGRMAKKFGVPFLGVLVDPVKNGFIVSYMGRKDVDSTNCHELKLLNPDANREYRCFLDARTYLLRKTIMTRPLPETINAPGGQTMNLSDGVTETVYGDYQPFGGILFPMRETATLLLGANAVQNVTDVRFKSYKINLTLAPELFRCQPGVKGPRLE